MRIYSPDSILTQLHRLSDGRHELVASPDDADVILVIFPWVGTQQIEEHELVERYPGKCFAISTTAYPKYRAHGVYTTVDGRAARLGARIRSGGYTTNTATYKNPFIESEALASGVQYPKRYLFSFIGRNCHPVRQALFNLERSHSDVLIEDSSEQFALWNDHRDESHIVSSQERFCEVLKASKFALCPRGISPNSIRLFEAMKLGIAPVILSDGWSFPIGPRWSEFSILVPERHVGELERILTEYEPQHQAMGRKAALAYQNWFSEEAYFNFLVASCSDIQRTQWLPEHIARFLIDTGYRLEQVVSRTRKKLGLRTRLKHILALRK